MNLLVAVDLRHEPEALVREAASWAERLQATVDLLYVDEYRTAEPYLRDPNVQRLVRMEWERLQREDRGRLQRLLELLPEERRGRVLLESGPPAEMVVEKSEDCDAVLVGTHGRRGLAHLWLGSVAERIVRTCNKPVLVLRVVRGAPKTG